MAGQFGALPREGANIPVPTPRPDPLASLVQTPAPSLAPVPQKPSGTALPAGFKIVSQPDGVNSSDGPKLPDGFKIVSQPGDEADKPKDRTFTQRYLTDPLVRGKNNVLDQTANVAGLLSGAISPDDFAKAVFKDQAEAAALPMVDADKRTMENVDKALKTPMTMAPDAGNRSFLQALATGGSVGVNTGGMKAAAEILKNPGVVPILAAESLPAMGTSIAGGTIGGLAGGATGGAVGTAVPVIGNAAGAAGGAVLGAATGVGLASGATEFASSLVGYLQETGQPADEAALAALVSDPVKLDEAKAYALKRGVPVGLFDALSAGIAGRLAKPVEKILGGKLGGKIAGASAEAVSQGAAGGAGEASAQYASEGKINDPSSILFEALAELPGAPLEVAGEIGSRKIGERFGKKNNAGDVVENQMPDQQNGSPAPQDGVGDAGSPPANSTPSMVHPVERAVLRMTNIPDEDIDNMSPEERQAEVEAALSSGQYQPTEDMVQSAMQYGANSQQQPAEPQQNVSPQDAARNMVSQYDPSQGQNERAIDIAGQARAEGDFRSPAQRIVDDFRKPKPAEPAPAPAPNEDPASAAQRMVQNYDPAQGQNERAMDIAGTVRADSGLDNPAQKMVDGFRRNPSDLPAPEPAKLSPAQQLIASYNPAKSQNEKALDIASSIRTGDDLRTPAQQMIDSYRRSGTRQAPATVQSSEDMTNATQHVNTSPSDAQIAAGNYQKGHVKVSGIDVTIETPKGATRRGTGPDGKPWSVDLPAHYGYVKRTTGADGDQVDVYVGDNHTSKRVYVVDQIDATTRRFDEHKAIMGASTLSEARALYQRGFSDGKGAQRIGAITPMSTTEFRKWLKNGQTNKPVRFGKANTSITEDGFPADAKGNIKKPESLIEYLAKRGGIRDEGGTLQSMGLTDRKTGFVQGGGPLVRAQGMSLDKARALALEAGYLDDAGAESGNASQSYVSDLLDALDNDMRSSRQKFSRLDADHAERWMASQTKSQQEAQYGDQETFNERNSKWTPETALDEVTKVTELKRDDPFALDIAREMADTGKDFDTAALAVEARYEQNAFDADIKADAPVKDIFSDIPFFGDRADESNTGTAFEGGAEDPADAPNRDRSSAQSGSPERSGTPQESGQVQSDVISREPDQSSTLESQPVSQQEATGSVTSEAGADGKQQLVIPGAERITKKQEAQRKADAALKSKVPQKDVGGLFGDEPNSPQLFDKPAPKPAPKDEPKAQAEPSKPKAAPEKPKEDLKPDAKAKIDDFGETLHGARKHMSISLSETLKDKSIDIGAEPLSKSFPQPDYVKLEQEGASIKALALVAMFRDTIPTKPKKSWKLSRWVEQVQTLRGFADKLISGEQSADDAITMLQSMRWGSELADIANTANALADIPAAQIPLASKFRISSGKYSVFNGVPYSPSKTLYTIKGENGRTIWQGADGDKSAMFDETLEGITKKAKAYINGILKKSKEEKPETKYTPVNLYKDRATNQIFIGFKVRSTVIRLKGGFENIKSAREYLAESRDEIQDKIDEMRKPPELRRATNDPRKGRDWRDGDVTPETFAKTFGFRGVQFGNYVEGPRRQADLNRAYDALIDLADAVGLPPKAISLGQKLGLAFGARGKGGKNSAAAHYEPDRVVINLTKEAGPGTLAHEWLHGIDNYFGGPNGFREGAYASSNKKNNGQIRDEVFKAWKDVEKAVNQGDFLKRANELDKARSKPYYAQTIELAARAFEKYIVDKLGKNGYINDYLANISEASGAYPTDAEMQNGIATAFDNLFNTIEAKADDQGVMRLYSANPDGWGSVDGGTQQVSLSDEEKAKAEEIVKRVSGLENVQWWGTIKIDGAKDWGTTGPGTAAGFFSPMNDLIALALDTAGTAKTAYHEAFHRLQYVFLDAKTKKLLVAQKARLRQIVELKNEKSRAAGMSQSELEAEAFGVWADQMDANDAAGIRLHVGIRKIWQKIKNTMERIKNALNGMGYQTLEDVFGKARSGETAKGKRENLGKTQDRQYSLNPTADPANFAPPKGMAPEQVPGWAIGTRITETLSNLPDNTAKKMKENGKYDRITKDDGESLADYTHRKLIDYLNPVKTMENSVGTKLSDLNSPYLIARLSEGTTRHEIQKVDDMYIQPMVQELAASGASLEDLHNYMYAMHAPERNRVVGLRNEEGSDLYKAATDPSITGASGMSTNDANKIIADFKRDQKKFQGIRKAASNVRAMLDNNLKAQLRSGLINQATYDNLTKQWEHYVPLRSEADTEKGGSSMPSKSRGFDVRGDEFAAAVGRYSPADNVIVYAINQTEQSILRKERNNVGKATLRFINEFDPKGEKIAQVYWSEDPKDASLNDLTKAPAVYKRVIGSDGKVTSRKVNAFQMKDDVLAAKIGGKTYYIQFADPKVGLALKKMTFAELGVGLKLLQKVSNWQSIINTRANPAFIPINLVRDIQTGSVLALSKGFSVKDVAKIVKDIPSAWGALWRAARGKEGNGAWDTHLEEFKAAGGKISFDQFNTIESTLEKLQNDLKSQTGQNSAVKGWNSFTKLIEDLNDTIENGLRLSVYAAGRKRGQTAKEAAFDARDLTVDFQKKGEIAPAMNAAYVFFNASIQGNFNIAKALAKSPKVRAVMGTLILGGFMQGIINSMFAGEGDDGENAYEKLLREQPYLFERNAVFFLPGRTDYVTIPLGFGMNAFWHLGTQGQAVMSGGKEALPAILDSSRVAFGAFNPMGSGGLLNMAMPTIVDPFIDLLGNKNFAGNPIHPKENPFDPSPPPNSEQNFKSNSDLANLFAKGMNTLTGGDDVVPGVIDVYPGTLDYLWGFLSGGLGRFVVQSGETAYNAAQADFQPKKTPFVRSFYGQLDDDGKRAEFYNQREAVGLVQGYLKNYSAQGNREKYDALVAGNPAEAAVAPIFSKINEARKKISKQKRQVEGSDRSDEEKANLLKELEAKDLALMNKARMAYAEARKKKEKN